MRYEKLAYHEKSTIIVGPNRGATGDTVSTLNNEEEATVHCSHTHFEHCADGSVRVGEWRDGEVVEER